MSHTVKIMRMYRNLPPSVSWDTGSVPVEIARIRDHWFIANVPVVTLI
jgi:hypothetical protein